MASPGNDAAEASGEGRKRHLQVESEATLQKKSRTVDPVEHGLCDRCARMNWRAVARWDLGKRHFSFVMPLEESKVQLETSSCKTCRVFSTIKSKSPASDGELWAFSANNVFARARKLKRRAKVLDSIVLGYVRKDVVLKGSRHEMREAAEEAGFIGIVEAGCHYDVGPRIVESTRINVKLVSGWLRYCKTNHQDCLKSGIPPSLQLHFIDCQSKEIVSATAKESYIALSYVWGNVQSTQDPANASRLDMSSLPKVVIHSITMALNLGYRYLWVDRYCIDQSNDAEKHDQISQMDEIYRLADITFVASAGEDANYGLPGVGDKPRRMQPQTTVSDLTFLHTWQHPSRVLEKSKWAQRGWTYQEGIMSRRRLVFADEQVFFQCSSMHCSEAVAWPFHIMHQKQSGKFSVDVPYPYTPFAMHSRDPKSLEDAIQSWHSCVNDYKTKQLAYSSIILNGVLGIFRTFRRSAFPVTHLWGVPVLYDVPDPLGFPTDLRAIDLGWYHEASCSARREGFPSWSWTGWLSLTIPIRFSNVHHHRRRAYYANVEAPGQASLKVWNDALSLVGGDDNELVRLVSEPRGRNRKYGRVDVIKVIDNLRSVLINHLEKADLYTSMTSVHPDPTTLSLQATRCLRVLGKVMEVHLKYFSDGHFGASNGGLFGGLSFDNGWITWIQVVREESDISITEDYDSCWLALVVDRPVYQNDRFYRSFQHYPISLVLLIDHGTHYERAGHVVLKSVIEFQQADSSHVAYNTRKQGFLRKHLSAYRRLSPYAAIQQAKWNWIRLC